MHFPPKFGIFQFGSIGLKKKCFSKKFQIAILVRNSNLGFFRNPDPPAKYPIDQEEKCRFFFFKASLILWLASLLLQPGLNCAAGEASSGICVPWGDHSEACRSWLGWLLLQPSLNGSTRSQPQAELAETVCALILRLSSTVPLNSEGTAVEA